MEQHDSSRLSPEALELYGYIVEKANQVPPDNSLAMFSSNESWPCRTAECHLIAELATRTVLAPKVLLYIDGMFVLYTAPSITFSPNLFPVWRPNPA